MNITLYQMTDDSRKINKSLGTGLTIQNVKPLDPCTIMNPVIKLSHNATYMSYNYCHIPDFGGYYYINNKTLENGFIFLSLTRDVLMSNAGAILSSKATITRCANGDDYMVDNMAIQKDEIKTVVKHLGNAFTSGNTYVLIKGAINYVNGSDS